MKEQNWEDTSDTSKDYIEAATAVSEENSGAKQPANSSNSHLTELRRRIEERLDSKRIALEYEYDEFEEQEENFQ